MEVENVVLDVIDNTLFICQNNDNYWLWVSKCTFLKIYEYNKSTRVFDWSKYVDYFPSL